LKQLDELIVIGVVVEQTCSRQHAVELFLLVFRKGVVLRIQDVSLYLIVAE
jgi:hypothetical protein